MNAQHWRNMADYVITLKEVHMQFKAGVSWIAVIWHHTQGRTWMRMLADRYSAWTHQRTILFSGHYLRNRSTLYIGVLGYIGILQHKEHTPEVWHILPGTFCVCVGESICVALVPRFLKHTVDSLTMGLLRLKHLFFCLILFNGCHPVVFQHRGICICVYNTTKSH